MKNLVFLICLFVALTNSNAQSVKSQAKIIAGDFLIENGANKFSRVLGKALVTSGEMNYEMEQIRAVNNSTRNVNIKYSYENLPPNTHLNSNKEVVPNQGYSWSDPSNPQNYDVTYSSYSNEPLPYSYLDGIKKSFFPRYIEKIESRDFYIVCQGQDLETVIRNICKMEHLNFRLEAQRVYEEIISENDPNLFPSNKRNILKTSFIPGTKLFYNVRKTKFLETGLQSIFFCKWIYTDSNREGIKFNDFKYISNKFNHEEGFSLVVVFSANYNETISLRLKALDNITGENFGEIDFGTVNNKEVSGIQVYYLSYPNGLPPGEYLIIVTIESSRGINGVTSVSEVVTFY